MDPIAHPPPVQGCTNFKLRRLLRAVGRVYDAEIGQAGLKGTQYSLLAHVATMDAPQPAELARRMGLDASTLSRNLRPLLDAGWLELRSGDDARSRRVALTDAGRDKFREARRHWRRAQATLVERLGLERVRLLHSLVDQGLPLLDDEGDSGQSPAAMHSR